MNKNLFFSAIFIILTLSFVLSYSFTGFSVLQEASIGESYLEELRLNAEVECLQNSQCSENQECVDNECLSEGEINFCESENLYSEVRKLGSGDSINSVKRIFTDKQLPYLLSDGELVKISDEKTIEYFYIQMIKIGENKIEDSFILSDEPLYTYKIVFSKSVNFSDKDFYGQVLRILGKEYLIEGNSNQSKIYLDFGEEEIVLDDSEIDFRYDEDGKIDEVGIWSRVLTSGEISDLYNSGSGLTYD